MTEKAALFSCHLVAVGHTASFHSKIPGKIPGQPSFAASFDMTKDNVDLSQDQSLALEIIATHIRAWDPMGLLAFGSRVDEYDLEEIMILEHLDKLLSPSDIAHVLAQVFCRMFNEPTFTPTLCFLPADQIFAGLLDAGLIPARKD